jgi:hypothetical protein
MISILCPTRKRPANLIRLLQSIDLTIDGRPDAFELICYVDNDDFSYSTDAPEFRRIKWVKGPRIVMSDMWNELIPHATGDIFMLCGDDVIFRTPGWNAIVEDAFAASKDKILVVFGDDGGPGGKFFASLPFVHRRWVEIVGYFAGPGYSADFADTWPNDVADLLGRKKRLPFVIEHLHPVWGKAAFDEVYLETAQRKVRDATEQRYADRMPQRIADAEKLRGAMLHGHFAGN